ncbi:aspartate-ammonia lyase [Mangrovimonas sp. DI 80]|uniref:aspartate-ammonia lyase n=1 Tax=Mangrovimonas sp. DI 80 TaxID=1779330 RepID=UPI0009765C05|nr:aspartate-ammonia lyase [Mangrovimonas sp. DI 80]OMP30071.1 aspartate-ammonia lyase [Mangrovimonas sp. DI 80]
MDNNLIANAGEFFVCAQLSKKGILTLLTPKNNPLFDIIATDNLGSKHVAIQVKTMGIGNKQGWKLNKQITVKKNNPNLFLILVDLKEDGLNNFYVYLYDDFVDKVNETYQEYITKPHARTGEPKKDVSFRWFNYKDFKSQDHSKKNKWDLIFDKLN